MLWQPRRARPFRRKVTTRRFARDCSHGCCDTSIGAFVRPCVRQIVRGFVGRPGERRRQGAKAGRLSPRSSCSSRSCRGPRRRSALAAGPRPLPTPPTRCQPTLSGVVLHSEGNGVLALLRRHFGGRLVPRQSRLVVSLMERPAQWQTCEIAREVCCGQGRKRSQAPGDIRHRALALAQANPAVSPNYREGCWACETHISYVTYRTTEAGQPTEGEIACRSPRRLVCG
jgi:hypothetical protein